MHCFFMDDFILYNWIQVKKINLDELDEYAIN